jgi:hypothetical protein
VSSTVSGRGHDVAIALLPVADDGIQTDQYVPSVLVIHTRLRVHPNDAGDPPVRQGPC